MPDVIAVDLGGTNIRAARVNAQGEVLGRCKIATQASEGMNAVVGRVAKLVNYLKKPSTLAVGVGTPGVPDPVTGVMRLPAVNIPGSANYPLTAQLMNLLQMPVAADNDGNLAALGESWKGAGVGQNVVVIFTLGTGIGGGCVINGQAYHGNHNLGTEFGHISIDYKGRPCPCGGHGCVEQYASAAALGRDAREALRESLSAQHSLLMQMCKGRLGIDSVDARMVCDAAEQGDALALELLDRCALCLATGVGAVINAFNPSCVILGGGLSQAGELLASRVRANLNNGCAFAPIWRDCELRLGMLGDDAGILGAARAGFALIGQ